MADGTGGHAFSDNYDQHQKNVAKLRGLAATLVSAKSDSHDGAIAESNRFVNDSMRFIHPKVAGGIEDPIE